MHTLNPLQTADASFIDHLMGWPQVLGVPVLLLAVWVVYQRTQSSADPRGNLSFQTDTGSASVLISGAYWVAALVLVAAFFLEPVIVEFPMLAAGLVLLVGVAYWIEKREAMS